MIKSFLKGLFIFLNYSLTILLSVGVIISVLSTKIQPIESNWLPFFSLGAPLLIFLALIMFLLNAISLKWIALLPLIALLACYSNISSIVNFPAKKQYNQNIKTLKIATHNVHNFRDYQWNDALDSTLTILKRENPHIIAIQEYTLVDSISQKIKKDLRNYKFSVVSFLDKSQTSLAIFSKYPIIGKEELEGNNNGYIWADIVTPIDTIRLFNIHLKSNNIDASENNMLSNLNVKEEPQFRLVAEKYKANSIIRATQADTIAQNIAKSPYNVIMCGDFNDVPFSYTFNKIKGDMNDSFAEMGYGYAYSYNQLMRLLKIDYILAPDNYEFVSYKSILTPYSDHNPIFVELVKGI